MSNKKLPDPRLTLGKAIRNGLLGWAIFSFMAFVYNSILAQYATGTPEHSLVTDIVFGSGFLPLYLWLFWAWRPRRKHSYWHRWLAGMIINLYFLCLLLIGSAVIFYNLLPSPWIWVVVSLEIALFLVLLGLPLISHRAAEKLVDYQWKFSGRIIGLGGLAGILGALFGMRIVRSGHMSSGLLVAALLLLLVTLMGAQYMASYFWRYRPWAKEEE